MLSFSSGGKFVFLMKQSDKGKQIFLIRTALTG